MNINSLIFFFALLFVVACSPQNASKKTGPTLSFDSLAVTPPMGWNSYDCFGTTVNEGQVRSVTDYMAANLSKYGYKYIVIDAGWFYAKDPVSHKRTVTLDPFGRFIPDTAHFPSAKDGHGFKALAAYVHSKGLKFGLHLMRGIPKDAVSKKTSVKGTSYFASDIANLKDSCDWSDLMWGLNMEKPGAQEYYNSVFELFAEWNLDFVKIDDISYPFHGAEIEGVHKAIQNTKTPMVISLSPGPAPTAQLTNLAKYAHLWRISDDFWDDWKLLKNQFRLCHQWDSIHIPGHWPDADMLPLGRLRKNHGMVSDKEKTTGDYSHFTDPEKYTLMTLWSIFKSPLILGGYLPENDSVTTRLITNEEVIALNQKSSNNHEIRNSNGIVIWIADLPGTQAKYVAIFNTNDEKPETISFTGKEIGVDGEQNLRDLWAKKDLEKFTGELSVQVEPHACRLFKIGK